MPLLWCFDADWACVWEGLSGDAVDELPHAALNERSGEITGAAFCPMNSEGPSKFDRVLTRVGVTAAVASVCTFGFAVLSIVLNTRDEASRDPEGDGLMIRVVRAFVLGGVLMLVACVCAYIDRYRQRKRYRSKRDDSSSPTIPQA